MILVDIYVPSVGQTYDFRLDENAQIQVMIEEIAEMIATKERTNLVGDPRDLILCDRLNKRTLPDDRSLRECGIGNGSSMLLV